MKIRKHPDAGIQTVAFTIPAPEESGIAASGGVALVLDFGEPEGHENP